MIERVGMPGVLAPLHGGSAEVLVPPIDRYLSAQQGRPMAGRFGVGPVPTAWAPPVPTAPALPLRDYQSAFVQQAWYRHQRGQDRVLGVAPTGSGKSWEGIAVAEALTAAWHDQQRFHQLLVSSAGWGPCNSRRLATFTQALVPPPGILCVVHRGVLCDQWMSHFQQRFGQDAVGALKSKAREMDRPIVVASAQTLLTQLDHLDPRRIGCVLLDEAHHYTPDNAWGRVLQYFGFIDAHHAIQGVWPRLLVGLTATPDRLTGMPLRAVYGPEGLVQAIDPTELWDRPDRVLLKPELIEVTPSQPINTASGAALGAMLAELFYDRLHEGDQFHHTLVYVNSVEQIDDTVAALKELGITAEGIIGDTPEAVRTDVLAQFREGTTRVLVNFGVAGEGFDVPSVETVVLLFESESRTRVVHAIGRVMRVDPARPHKIARVVDCGGNVRRHKLAIQPREAYAVEMGATLVQVPGTGTPHGPRTPPAATVTVATVEAMTLAGDRPITTHMHDTLAHLGITAGQYQQAAYRLGVTADVVFAYANGLRVPASLTEVTALAAELGDAENLLLDAWANEKVAQMEVSEPLTGVSPEAAAFARTLRYGLWRLYDGVASRVSGSTPETVRAWCNGTWPFQQKNELWERVAARIGNGLVVRGQERVFFERCNALLQTRQYPQFLAWMIEGPVESILIGRLQALTQRLGHPPSAPECRAAPGLAAPGTYWHIFGSWNAALGAAGLAVNQVHIRRDRATLIADLQALAQRLGHTPTAPECQAAPGLADPITYRHIFGSWNAALGAAGLAVNKVRRNRATLIADLQALAQRLGHTPTAPKCQAAPGLADPVTYARIFGSWNQALAVAGLTPRKPGRQPRK